MAFSKKQQEADFDFLAELTQGVEDIEAGFEELSIVDFVHKKVDAYDMEMLLGNRTVLKAFFQEAMDEEERATLERWASEGRTNWQDPEEVIALQNFKRALEGRDPLTVENFQWRELIIEGGMRSGKTQMSAFVALFLSHTMMGTPRSEWNKRLGINIPQGVPIYITCLAATADSTDKTIYGQIKSYMKESKFFKKLMDQGRLIMTDTDIKFPENNFTIVAGNSRAAGQVGRAAILVIFDEIAFHTNDQGKSNAKDLYDRLGRSTTNLGNAAKILAISSVKEEGDFMQELQAESWDKQHLGCLCFRLPTWELNEALSPEAPVIAKAYAADPVTAARDYENVRPAAEDAFLNAHLVDLAISHENDKVIKYTRGTREATVNNRGRDETLTYVTNEIHVVDRVSPDFMSVAHADPGVVKDSFGLAVGHAEASQDGIVTIIDFVMDWVPLRGPKGDPWKVDFVNVEDVILQLWKARNIIRQSFDHWQGEGSIQRLWREGMPAVEDNFNGPRQFAGYKLFRDRLNAGLVKIPNHPALIEELKNLILKNGSRVDHPKKMSMVNKKPLSKDLADAVMAVDNYIAIQGAAFARGANVTGAHIVAQQSSFNPVGQTGASQINWGFN